MPELPEVETVARQLAPHLESRTVRSVAVLDPKLRVGRLPRLAGRSVTSVTRSGKRVLIAFSEQLWLAVHLRMTGRLIWFAGAGPSRRPQHLRARVRFEGGDLLFLDARRFGTFSWYGSETEAAPPAIDPLDPALTPRRLSELLEGSPQALKSWLLRQDRLVGLGNIYASEILWRAKLSPLAAAGSLDAAEVRRLHASMRHILNRAIEAGGTTFSDYQDARGEEGAFQSFLAVYDRAGRSCRRCRRPVERLVQQQRSTYWCPGCQG